MLREYRFACVDDTVTGSDLLCFRSIAFGH